VFRLILWIVGVWLSIRSRTSSRVRAQITRDFTITLATKTGVARTFAFGNRLVTSRAGEDENCIVSLTFTDQSQAVKTLIAKNAPFKLVRGLAKGEILYSGDLPYILWFYELIMSRIPGRDRSVEKKMPCGYVKPDLTSKIGSKIIREAPENHLNPEWHNAILCREKLIIWSVGRGGEVVGKQENYPHVVLAPANHKQLKH